MRKWLNRHTRKCSVAVVAGDRQPDLYLLQFAHAKDFILQANVKKPRILVVRGGAIGDFIMTLPAIGALRERWPEAHIEILGYPHIAELAQGRYYADAMRSIDAKAMTGF